MAKKKNQDFSKIKVKIGKHKPSKNVTKFNIKTGKVVIPGDNPNKVPLKKDNENCLSMEKNDLIKTLNRIDLIVTEYLSKKRSIQQAMPLDLTQSIWPTYFYPRVVTPWDDLLDEFSEKMGAMEPFFLGIFDNARICPEMNVKVALIRTINLYLELTGDAENYSQISRKVIFVAKQLYNSTTRGQRQLGLELLSSVAKHSPASLWYHSRRRASSFALEIVKSVFPESKRTHERLLDDAQAVQLASEVLAAVVDGRRRSLIFVGEDSSQIHDLSSPPINTDFHYTEFDSRECKETLMEVVTDCRDTLVPIDCDLQQCLTVICDEVLGLDILPVAVDCEKSLQKTVWTVQTLSRGCMVVNNSAKWTPFIEDLMEGFPYELKVTDVAEEVDEPIEEEKNMKGLSKKDKKLRKQRMVLEAKMRELCRNAKTVNDVKGVHKLNEDLNYYTVALVHQCIVSEKIEVTESFTNFLSRFESFIDRMDRSRNEVTWRWTNLAKQMLRLTFDRCNYPSVPLCQVLVRLTRDLFLTAHPLSRIKRLSLAVFTEACLGLYQLAADNHGGPMIDLPEVDALLFATLMTQIEADGTDRPGRMCAHPWIVSAKQTHLDVTLERAVYLLLLADYPGVADLANGLDHQRAAILRRLLCDLRLETSREAKQALRKIEISTGGQRDQDGPSCLLWDYFGVDEVRRRDAPPVRLPPLCSSVASFMVK